MSGCVNKSTRGIRDDDSLRGQRLGRQADGQDFGHGHQYRGDSEERTPLRIDVGNMIRTREKEVGASAGLAYEEAP